MKKNPWDAPVDLDEQAAAIKAKLAAAGIGLPSVEEHYSKDPLKTAQLVDPKRPLVAVHKRRWVFGGGYDVWGRPPHGKMRRFAWFRDSAFAIEFARTVGRSLGALK